MNSTLFFRGIVTGVALGMLIAEIKINKLETELQKQKLWIDALKKMKLKGENESDE